MCRTYILHIIVNTLHTYHYVIMIKVCTTVLFTCHLTTIAFRAVNSIQLEVLTDSNTYSIFINLHGEMNVRVQTLTPSPTLHDINVRDVNIKDLSTYYNLCLCDFYQSLVIVSIPKETRTCKRHRPYNHDTIGL